MNIDMSSLMRRSPDETNALVGRILDCNRHTAQYGLTLDPGQAMALAETRENALRCSGRIEFGTGITEKLIMAFCDSPYISQGDYEATLHELTLIFYDMKNETWDAVSDDELIGSMREAFDVYCHGSADILAGSVMPQLAKHIHRGGDIKDFIYREER